MPLVGDSPTTNTKSGAGKEMWIFGGVLADPAKNQKPRILFASFLNFGGLAALVDIVGLRTRRAIPRENCAIEIVSPALGGFLNGFDAAIELERQTRVERVGKNRDREVHIIAGMRG